MSFDHNYTKKAELLARDIYDWCKVNDFWGDNIIYFNGKAWSSSEEWAGVEGKCINEDLYEYDNKDPREYFEYVREPNILSMSFEGPLNHLLNGYIGHYSYEEAFSKLFEQFGLYYEMGYAWTLSAYEI